MILLAAGILRLGFLADFVSVPVLTGFKAGMGLLIVAGQLGKMLGVDVNGDVFFDQLWSAARHVGDANLTTVALAAATIAVVLGLMRWAPSLPAPLIGLGLGIAAVAVVNLEAHGVRLITPIPEGLPALGLPSLRHGGRLLPSAAGIALIVFGSLQGVLIGVGLSVLVLFYEANRPPILVLGRRAGTQEFRDLEAHPDGETWPRLLIIRPTGALYFANARRVYDREVELIDRLEVKPSVVIADSSAVPDADVTAVDQVEALHDALEAREVELWFAAPQGPLLAMLERSPKWPAVVAAGRVFATLDEAVGAFERRRSEPR